MRIYNKIMEMLEGTAKLWEIHVQQTPRTDMAQIILELHRSEFLALVILQREKTETDFYEETCQHGSS